jgi:preprotein translocase subunit Sec61beta
MLDEFREQAGAAPFFEEEEAKPAPRVQPRYFLGMSPAQRFVIALMLLLIVGLVGVLGLVVAGRVVLPF